jgi:hypothetical protein
MIIGCLENKNKFGGDVFNLIIRAGFINGRYQEAVKGSQMRAFILNHKN